VCSKEVVVGRRVIDTSVHHGLKHGLMSRESSSVNGGQLGEGGVTKIHPPINTINLVSGE
jgi:hypothetical protein